MLNVVYWKINVYTYYVNEYLNIRSVYAFCVGWHNGVRQYSHGDYHGAIQRFCVALNDTKNDREKSACYAWCGLSHGNLKQYEFAIADYNMAIDLDPNNAEYYRDRGASYHELIQYELAVADYNKAIELDPSTDLYYNFRLSRRNLKQYELAIDDYSTAIELDPNNAKYYNNRGYSYHELKQYELCIADYSTAIELVPNYAKYYNNRGYAYRVSGQHELAVADYSRAIELDASKAKHFYRRGDSYMKLKLNVLAVVDLTKAVEMEPENVEYREKHEFAQRELERQPNMDIESTNELRQQINEMNEKHDAVLTEIGEKSRRLDELFVKFQNERDLKDCLEVENIRLRMEVEELCVNWPRANKVELV